jgi:allantoinase
MCIAFHPYVTGHPQRIRAFERALRHVLSHDDVWLATGIEIESWYRENHLATMQEWLMEREAS